MLHKAPFKVYKGFFEVSTSAYFMSLLNNAENPYPWFSYAKVSKTTYQSILIVNSFQAVLVEWGQVVLSDIFDRVERLTKMALLLVLQNRYQGTVQADCIHVCVPGIQRQWVVYFGLTIRSTKQRYSLKCQYFPIGHEAHQDEGQ